MRRGDRYRTFGATEQGTVAVLANQAIDFDVPSRPDQVAGARHAVVDHLMARGVSSVVVDDIELVTSELVTNAIVHPEPTGSPVVVHVHVDIVGEIVLSVANVGPADAIPAVEDWHAASPTALSGRGLGIVRRLCDHVAVEQRGELAVVICRRKLPDGGARP
jgi:anti-sigma regulatory factor (Ser/Thr protein kinase)